MCQSRGFGGNPRGPIPVPPSIFALREDFVDLKVRFPERPIHRRAEERLLERLIHRILDLRPGEDQEALPPDAELHYRLPVISLCSVALIWVLVTLSFRVAASAGGGGGGLGGWR